MTRARGERNPARFAGSWAWRGLAGFLALCLMGVLAPAAAEEESSPRDRLHMLAEDPRTEADLQAEIRVGREVAARILARDPLVEDPELQRYVNLVGSAVAAHGDRSELSWYFAVTDSDEVNAYAAPGGYVFVTRGALKEMRDEAELAGVLAHEIAHITRRHIVDALDIRAPEDSPLAGITRFFGGATEVARVAFSEAVDQVMDVLFEDGLRREDELDADHHGLMLAVRTGYDPAGLPRYLARLAEFEEDDKDAVETVARTHPPASERLEALERLMEEQGIDGLEQPAREERFARHVR